jgi:hypothetical protein
MHLVQSELHIDTPTAQRIGTVKMDWHLLKRRYDLFLGYSPISNPFFSVCSGCSHFLLALSQHPAVRTRRR